MRVARIIFIIGLACVTGCTTGRLRQRTINQGSTLPELQYQQVLDNLARFATNPSALPWHVNLREGTTQITDSTLRGCGAGPRPSGHLVPAAPRLEDRCGPVGYVAGD